MPEPAFSIRQIKGDVDKEVEKLKKDARKKLRAEVRKVLTAETKTTRAAIKKSARDNLPKGGGLNRWAAVTPGVKVSLFDGDSARAAISMKKAGHDLKSLDDGEVRHPLYGNRNRWIGQTIQPGFFSDVVKDDADLRRRVTAALLKSLDNL